MAQKLSLATGQVPIPFLRSENCCLIGVQTNSALIAHWFCIFALENCCFIGVQPISALIRLFYGNTFQANLCSHLIFYDKTFQAHFCAQKIFDDQNTMGRAMTSTSYESKHNWSLARLVASSLFSRPPFFFARITLTNLMDLSSSWIRYWA